MLKQFEAYLNERDIKASNISENVSNSTIKRKKRSTPLISHTLSKSEVALINQNMNRYHF